IRLGEPSPAKQREPDGFEIGGIGGVYLRAGFYVRFAEDLEARPAHTRPAEKESLRGDDAHARHARNSGDAALHFVEDRDFLLRKAIASRGEIGHGAQHSFRTESQVLALQLGQVLKGETGAGEKHHGESDLDADQRLAESLTLAARAAG